MTKSLVVICVECGAASPRRGNYQKYCAPCSEKKDIQRQNQWAKDHPQSLAYTRARSSGQRSRSIQNGIEISQIVARNGIADDNRFVADRGWAVKFCFPFSQSGSKNHIYSLAKTGSYLFKRASTRTYQNQIATLTRSAMRGVKVHNNKIWIELFIQKPNHRGDAINMIDVVADALKVGVGIDDRWFCIRQVDWEIAKVDPQVFVTIYQRDTFDALACSHCGRILSLENFRVKKSAKSGSDRVCFECRTKDGVATFKAAIQEENTECQIEN